MDCSQIHHCIMAFLLQPNVSNLYESAIILSLHGEVKFGCFTWMVLWPWLGYAYALPWSFGLEELKEEKCWRRPRRSQWRLCQVKKKKSMSDCFWDISRPSIYISCCSNFLSYNKMLPNLMEGHTSIWKLKSLVFCKRFALVEWVTLTK